MSSKSLRNNRQISASIRQLIYSNISDQPHQKTLNQDLCVVSRYNKIISNCGSQTRTTRNSPCTCQQRGKYKIGMGQTFQTLEQRQTDLVRNTLGIRDTLAGTHWDYGIHWDTLHGITQGLFLCREQKRKWLGHKASPATSGPALWNNLPDDLRDPSLSLYCFQTKIEIASV